jgi:hypothetical protein
MYGEQECLKNARKFKIELKSVFQKTISIPQPLFQVRYRLYHSFRRQRHSPYASPVSTHNIATNISAVIVTASAAVTIITACTTDLLLVTSTHATYVVERFLLLRQPMLSSWVLHRTHIHRGNPCYPDRLCTDRISMHQGNTNNSDWKEVGDLSSRPGQRSSLLPPLTQ